MPTPIPAALATLHEALVAVSRLLAPAAPFLSDWLHRALAGTSVHLARFPASSGRRDEALEAAMEAVRRLASLARAAREERGLRVRQPLARMQVAVPAAARGPALDELLELLRIEVNVKAVEVVASDTELVRLRARPNFRSLGKRYGKRTPAVAAAAARLDADQLRGAGAGEPADAGGRRRGGDASCPRTSWSSGRWRATGWWPATGPTSRRSTRGSTRSCARKGSPGRW